MLLLFGIKIQVGISGLFLHQRDYIEAELRQRGCTDNSSKDSLPTIQEGQFPPPLKEEEESHEYKKDLAEAQSETGSIQWLALKTRPDIAAIAAGAASIQTRCPKEALRLMAGTLKYMAQIMI